ncbi:MAG: type II toxin-antitoxin system HicB family antitoxin [Alphaproteobacteria bacterium]|nr:MAG: type II toxin-antitoxin system HicB family antitoxin [Alphaproteobacteria bacterium]TMJ42158.1 MAG: type II toxin-antitoxin system HicB family antitoxin [Alphaproteobacteria bacterium]
MISYRVHLKPDDKGTFLVTSPDFPELTTFGETREEALLHALGAFEEAIEARISDREKIPVPTKGKAKDIHVGLPVQASVKVLLYQSMQRDGIRKADLARRMGIHKQEVDRILDLNHATSLSKIEHAFEVLGKRLLIDVRDADDGPVS